MNEPAGCGVAVLHRPNGPGMSDFAAFVAAAICCSIRALYPVFWALAADRPKASANAASEICFFMERPRGRNWRALMAGFRNPARRACLMMLVLFRFRSSHSEMLIDRRTSESKH